MIVLVRPWCRAVSFLRAGLTGPTSRSRRIYPRGRATLHYLSDMPGKVPQKPNEKKKGKTLKEKRAAKKAKKG